MVGYLRGTRAMIKYGPRPPTLRNKVARLERVVARARPERQTYTDGNNTASISAGYGSVDVDLTNEFISSAGFREKITGDKWYNEALKFMFYTSNGQINHVRVVVYKHNRPSGAISWGTSTASFTLLPDPSAVTIYYDRTFTQIASAATQIHGYGFCRCRNQTIYNSDSNVIENNAIRIAFIYNADGAAEIRWSAELRVRNK